MASEEPPGLDELRALAAQVAARHGKAAHGATSEAATRPSLALRSLSGLRPPLGSWAALAGRQRLAVVAAAVVGVAAVSLWSFLAPSVDAFTANGPNAAASVGGVDAPVESREMTRIRDRIGVLEAEVASLRGARTAAVAVASSAAAVPAPAGAGGVSGCPFDGRDLLSRMRARQVGECW